MLTGQDANFLSAIIVPSLDGLLDAGVIDQSDVKEINDLREANDEEVSDDSIHYNVRVLILHFSGSCGTGNGAEWASGTGVSHFEGSRLTEQSARRVSSLSMGQMNLSTLQLLVCAADTVLMTT